MLSHIRTSNNLNPCIDIEIFSNGNETKGDFQRYIFTYIQLVFILMEMMCHFYDILILVFPLLSIVLIEVNTFDTISSCIRYVLF